MTTASYGAYKYVEIVAPAAFGGQDTPLVDFDDTTTNLRLEAVTADVEVSYGGGVVHSKIKSGTVRDFPGLAIGKLWARSAAGAGTLIVTAW